MKKHVSRVLLLATTYSLTTSINAATALPVFTGIWYDEVQTDYYDACYNRILKYRNKVDGDAETLAKQLLGEVSKYPECQWGDIYIDNSFHDTGSPSDFDASRIDWDEIIKSNRSPIKLHWERDCKDSQGRIQYSKTAVTQPSYVCPKNSRIGLDMTSGSYRCLQPPLPCLGDIVGRDLSLPGFGFLGHVGIANQSFTDHIIEVLKKPKEAIYVHSLGDFKKFENTDYWGEKYNLAPESTMPIDKVTKVSKTAFGQIIYPFKYTLGWNYHPGSSYINYSYNQQTKEWEKVNAVRGAKFRCDSFIYYSYSAGAGLNIFPDFSPPSFPKDMFNKFLSCRDAEGTLCLPGNKDTTFIPPASESDITSIFSRPNINIQLADIATHGLVENRRIKRDVKINLLWSLALKNQNNPEKFGYLIDVLEALKPIELASEIMHLYQSQIYTENKIHLLDALTEILHFESKSDYIKVQNKEVTAVIEIQKFMRDILLNENDKEVVKYIIQFYPYIVTTSDSQRDIQSSLERIENIDKDLFTESEKTLLCPLN